MVIDVRLDGRSSGKTDKGYPIIVYVAYNYQQKKWRTGHYAKKNEWNSKLGMPTSRHPDYPMLSDYLRILKQKMADASLEASKGRMTFEDIKSMLFKRNHTVFYDAVMDSFPQNYKGTKWSAIRSFNLYYKGYSFEGITPLMVDQYIQRLLRKGNSPGGVDSYIRSLRALWYKLSKEPNPFANKKIEIPGKIKYVATEKDLNILVNAKLNSKGEISGADHYRNYWLLMFYLGGIDPEALSKLRYDQNVVGNRIMFNRNKGRSKTACNNLIPPEAKEILEQYNCAPYLVPIFMSKDYTNFLKNFSRRFRKVCTKLELSVQLRPKSARYTFIDRAQQMLVDERITAQIVGHKRKTTTSIYTNDFPQAVQDEAHLRITKIGKGE